MEVIRFNAGNDRNGNPQRVFVAVEDGEIVGTWDEGYQGVAAMPEAVRRRWGGLSFGCSVTEYRNLVHRWDAIGSF